jgi:hypothetical protein
LKLDFTHTCQKCKKRHASTRRREVYTKNYMGPCGDSFCYASCESSSCRPINITVCDPCAKKLSR